jgi:hypothetical protein
MESIIFEILIIFPSSSLTRQSLSSKVRKHIAQKQLCKDPIYERLHVDYLIHQGC